MDDNEIRKSAALEHRHWWYAERRALVRRLVSSIPAGQGLDVGCGGGGNTAVLRDLGWSMTGLDSSPTAVEIARSRGVDAVLGDATALPGADASQDLVISLDTWEHLEDHHRAAAESARVLRPGGRLLVAVPSGVALWSGHDVALGHVRRYERDSLLEVVRSAGFVVDDIRSWNVLLRPVVRLRRRSNIEESEMTSINPVLNAALRAVVATERILPLGRLPGVSLVARATKP
jgi:SAM-dependent methyltransferase